MSLPTQLRKALNLGCKQVADILIENNIPLNVAFKNTEIRPTQVVIKDIFKQIAKVKFLKDSTESMTAKEIDEVWVDMLKPLSEKIGEDIPFPNEKETDNYLRSYEKN